MMFPFMKTTATPAIALIILALAGQAHAARVEDKTIGWPGKTLSGNRCWGKGTGYGPYDYIRSPRPRIGVVEKFHFTSAVERLIKGESGKLHGDIDYTLRAVPNHHRALFAVSKLYLRDTAGSTKLDKMHAESAQRGISPPECYFQRGKVFAPEDGMISGIYGIYLHKMGRHDEALREYRIAEKAHPNHAEIRYNMGLLFFDMKRYNEAREYADRARALGYPLRGLRDKLDHLNQQKAAASN